MVYHLRKYLFSCIKKTLVLTTLLLLALGAHASTSSKPKILSAYYGYDNCIGINDVNGNGTNADEAKLAGCNTTLITSNGKRTLITNAASTKDLLKICSGQASAQTLVKLDGMPIVFSHQIIASSIHPRDIMVTLSNGKTSYPTCMTLSPANEENESRTLLAIGDFGSPQPKAPYPVKVTVVGNLMLQNPTGNPINAKGLTYKGEFLNYHLGPQIALVELEKINTSQERTQGDAYPNHCKFLFPKTTHIMRVTFTGGVTKDGIRSYLPNRTDLFKLNIENQKKNNIQFLGIADLGSSKKNGNEYVADGDNHIDLCLDVPKETSLKSIKSVSITCSKKNKTEFYDPSGDRPCKPQTVSAKDFKTIEAP